MSKGVRYACATLGAAVLVALVGEAVGGGAARAGVWAGAMMGFAVQVLVFWLLFVWLLPGRPGLAHGLGVLGRFVVVGAMALVWVPVLGVPAAPTLFALVGVFFVSTVIEPLFLQTDTTRR